MYLAQNHNAVTQVRLKPVASQSRVKHSTTEPLRSLDPNVKWRLNEGRKYCRMLPLEHSAILLTCIKWLLVLKTNFLSFWEWPFKTGLTVYDACKQQRADQRFCCSLSRYPNIQYSRLPLYLFNHSRHAQVSNFLVVILCELISVKEGFPFKHLVYHRQKKMLSEENVG